MDDFIVQIAARLDLASLDTDLKTIESNLNQKQIKIKPVIDLAASKAETEQYARQIKAVLESINPSFGKISVQSIVTAMNQVQREAEKTKATLNAIDSNVKLGTYSAQVEKVVASSQKWQSVNNGLKGAVEELRTAYENLTNPKTDNRIKAEQDFQNALTRTKNLITETSAQYATDSQIDSLSNKIQQFYDKNTAAHRQYGASLQSYIATLTSGAPVAVSELQKINKGFIDIQNSARQAGLLGKSFTDSIKDQAAKFGQWFSVTAVVMKGIQSVKSSVQSVRELDTALVDLKKTTDATSQQLNSFYYSANDTAKELGVTTREVIQAAGDGGRLGSTIEDAQKMAENSSIFASISPDLDIDQATDGLVSAMKAFKVEVEDSLDGVISKINIIGRMLPKRTVMCGV